MLFSFLFFLLSIIFIYHYLSWSLFFVANLLYTFQYPPLVFSTESPRNHQADYSLHSLENYEILEVFLYTGTMKWPKHGGNSSIFYFDPYLYPGKMIQFDWQAQFFKNGLVKKPPTSYPTWMYQELSKWLVNGFKNHSHVGWKLHGWCGNHRLAD